MIFYDCNTAPSPRRVRMFIKEKKINIETKNVDLRNSEQMAFEQWPGEGGTEAHSPSSTR